MRDSVTLQQLANLRGRDVYDFDGRRIGVVDEIFYESETRRAEWIGIGNSFFPDRRLVVPLRGAELRDDGLALPYDCTEIEDAPDVEGDVIAPAVEHALIAHYGLDYDGEAAELPEPGDPPQLRKLV